MNPKIYASEVYLEIARAFSRGQIGIDSRKCGLTNPNDLPIATQIHLQFALSSVSIIFSISFLEAMTNNWLNNILKSKVELTSKNMLDNGKREKIIHNFDVLKDKYSSEKALDELYRKTLIEKIKILYKTFEAKLPYQRKDKLENELWQELITLQNLRHDLIHLKPEFLESHRFIDFIRLSAADREKKVNVPIMIAQLMEEELPTMFVNLTQNALISSAMLIYQNNQFLENMLLGREYEQTEKNHFMSRFPRKI